MHKQKMRGMKLDAHISADSQVVIKKNVNEKKNN